MRVRRRIALSVRTAPPFTGNLGAKTMAKTTCADVGDFPAGYSKSLPKHANVPLYETDTPGKTW